MGCAIIWKYAELFGADGRIARAVLVDQAPLQARRAGFGGVPAWEAGSKGLPDDAALRGLQGALLDMPAFARGNAECCLTLPLPPDVAEVLAAETLKAHPDDLGLLMADHTNQDHRFTLPTLSFPCLVMAGAHSGCFPMEGLMYLQDTIPDCRTAVFERANHWLYVEEPDEFNRLVREFCEERLPKGEVMRVA